MKLLYFTNQYPKVSHSFIRREIQAMESIGHEIIRISVRRTNDATTEDDTEEFKKTRVLLDEPARVVWSLTAVLLSRPLKSGYTLKLCWKLGGRFQWGRLKYLAYFAEACLLLRIARNAAIEHMHVHFGTNPAAVALLCRRLGGPQYSVTVHGPEEFDNPLIISLPEKIADAKFVVAISEHGRGQLKRWCPYRCWPKVALVKCGLAEDFLNVEPTPVPDVQRIVCIARLSAQKAVAVLIQALGLLQQEQTNVSVDIVGDGPDRASMEVMIDELSVRDRVNITGFVNSQEVRRYIECSRALVLPSLAEGLPVVVMEAFSLGRPVIASRVSGVSELVEDGVNGWLVPPGETTDLAVAIRRLLDTPVSVLSAMASRGRAHVLREHDIRRQSMKLDELFHIPANAPDRE